MEELAAHLDDCYAESLASGATPAEARRRTHAELSEPEVFQRELGRVERPITAEPIVLGAQRRTNLLADLWHDVRYGVCVLAKQPGFTLAAMTTLALGIGANTAIFSVINALILNPSHFADAERVAKLWRTPRDKRIEGYLSYLELQDWRDGNRSFEAIAGYKPNGCTLLTDDLAERIEGMRVTASPSELGEMVDRVPTRSAMRHFRVKVYCCGENLITWSYKSSCQAGPTMVVGST